MAARKQPNHTPDIRAKIQASQLVNMLNELALTGLYQGVQVSPERIKAAQILLAKALPDLKAIDHTGTVAHTFPGVHIHPPGG